MSAPTVLVHRDADELAAAVAARLVTSLVDLQSSRGEASLVLTGGGIAGRIYTSIAESAARGAVDWSRVDIWWGDERFLPSGDPERNETVARETLLDQVPVDPARVHPMPSSDGPDGDDPEAAAARYADELGRASRPEDDRPAPSFDICLLGVGPDGHIASLFPGQPALHDDRPVVAVREAPKPPPVRITLTIPVIQASRQVWCVVSGDDKASAVATALSGAGPTQVPAAAASGRDRTLWLLDRAAAGKLPAGRDPVASLMAIAAYVADLRSRVGQDLLLLPAVCALAFDDRGELLLHQRTDTGRWSLPGGAIDPGEQPADAVVREVLEETAVRVAPTRITGVYLTPEVRYPNGDLVQYVITAFECVSEPGDLPRVNDDESLAVGYFPLDALPELSPAHVERITHATGQQAAAFFEPAHQ